MPNVKEKRDVINRMILGNRWLWEWRNSSVKSNAMGFASKNGVGCKVPGMMKTRWWDMYEMSREKLMLMPCVAMRWTDGKKAKQKWRDNRGEEKQIVRSYSRLR